MTSKVKVRRGADAGVHRPDWVIVVSLKRKGHTLHRRLDGPSPDGEPVQAARHQADKLLQCLSLPFGMRRRASCFELCPPAMLVAALPSLRMVRAWRLAGLGESPSGRSGHKTTPTASDFREVAAHDAVA